MRRILYSILGQENYLFLIKKLFLISYSLGFLKSNRVYDWHYFSKNLIRPDDQIIDIGANLGYYTTLYRRWTGPESKIYAVEPIPLFRKILKKGTERDPRLRIIPFALGPESGSVRMGIPGDDILHHGYTRVLDIENEKTVQTFEAEMRTPEEVFADLERVDYVKCDVEGFEDRLVPLLTDIIRKHSPLIQIESGQPQRKFIFSFLQGMEYEAYGLKNNLLFRLDSDLSDSFGDILFCGRDKSRITPFLRKS